ncbi:hypothetical protein QJS10_CPA07g01294 [Acorus calamus]|uniref:Late embryogenesis abundant protein LEA-2 subgroup domain-containing protein n=1 Tax=Acorus calamus TaxID=4465 RepID=A0AAV9EHA5_ACOCL|nr:hypothetical protein QJS10_CPA07g01294 [Acorus calamus]
MSSNPTMRSILVISCFFCLCCLTTLIYFCHLYEYSWTPPIYAVHRLSIDELNLSSPTLWPKFELQIAVKNQNKLFGFSYGTGSKRGSTTIRYSSVSLAYGFHNPFYQEPDNVAVVQTELLRQILLLSDSARRSLVSDERRSTIALQVGMASTLGVMRHGGGGGDEFQMVSVGVRCEVVVDRLKPDSKIVSQSCKVSIYE